MIQISPGITHLDITRVEQMPDGSTLERSTREWAMQLTLADGVTSSARCDIVNGSSDHNAYLLVPQPHYADIKEAFTAYQFRLNLLGERETRFRDSLPDLPSVIHVDVSTQANLDFLEHLSSDEKWRRAPASVRGGVSAAQVVPAAACRPASSTTSSMDGHSVAASEDVMWPPPAPPGGGGNPSTPKLGKKSPGCPPASTYKNSQSDDQTAVSQRLDSSTITALLSRITNMEKAQQEFQLELQKIATISAGQHADVQERLRCVDTLSETIVQSITEHQCITMASMKNEFEGMLTGFFTSFASGQQASFPTIPPPSSVDPTLVPVTMPSPAFASAASHPPSHVTPGTTSCAVDSSASAHLETSSGSARSYSSDVELPQQKKSRGSIQADMSHLSIQPSDTESVYSDLGDVLYSGVPPTTATDQSPWSPTAIEDPPSSHATDEISFPHNVTLPDLDNQYNEQLAPDGGANG